MDPTICRLCGAPLPASGDADGRPRCFNCGLYPAGDLGRRGYGRLAAGLAGVYAVTALVVLLVRG
jgi:hypothetical protein